jgi:hypothetical protein
VKTYEQMHSGLHWARGRASEHSCVDCGGPAKDWAFRYTAGDLQIVDDRGRAYSERFEDYEPMCRSCHRRFDMLQPDRREFQLAHLARINAAAAADPNYRQRMREQGEKGRAVLAERRARGLAVRVGQRTDTEQMKAAGKALGAIRRRCLVCGLETAAGPLVRHQKLAGHEGWEPV